MSRQTQFTSIANEVSVRYTSFLETLLNSYNRVILSANLNAKSLSIFKSETNNILKHYLEREVDELIKVYNDLADIISNDTDNYAVKVLDDSEWSEYLTENTNFLYEAIKLQSSKDTLYLNNYLRTKVLQVLSMNEAQIAYNLIHNHKDLSFYYTDKIGRKINSAKYIRTSARDYLIKNYNDLIVGTALLNDKKELIVENLDKEHKDHGKIISINQENEINYFNIRDEVFHPNSNSIIRIV